MPELPEVETVRRGLVQIVPPGTHFCGVVIKQYQLRRRIPTTLAQAITTEPLQAIERRAKYLLWHFPQGTLINHLGMTGSWRLAQIDHPSDQHDHVRLLRAQQPDLIYRDPRRFGVIDWCPAASLANYKSLARLGPEPLSNAFNGAYLQHQLQRRKGPIKGAIMDQQVVVGVGNIYAAEALFRAAIRPHAAACTIGPRRLKRLVTAIREVLSEAITAGGSTIRDFRQAGGSAGYFQHNFLVYGRAGQPCSVCGRALRGNVIAGRASVWCAHCQRS